MRAFRNMLMALVAFSSTSAVAGGPSAASPVPPPSGMALIPAGRYSPLFRAEKDPKEVAVRAFFLDVAPVTNAEYLEFVKANPKWRRSQVKRLFADEGYLESW